MRYLKTYEKYNNNKLNELIVKYFNEYSEELIEIINTYKKPSDVENIMQKISFIIESPGDVETVEKDGKIIAYFVDMKEVDSQTILFEMKNEKFHLNSYKNFMDNLEK